MVELGGKGGQKELFEYHYLLIAVGGADVGSKKWGSPRNIMYVMCDLGEGVS